MGFGVALGEQGGERVIGHALDVFHQFERFPEDMGIDALVDVADADAGLVVPGAICVIDMAGAVGLRVDEVGAHAADMLGNTLVTVQTGDAGKQVNRLYVTDGVVTKLARLEHIEPAVLLSLLANDITRIEHTEKEQVTA